MNITGERISTLAREKGYSQKELATASGVTESAMSYYFRGERVPRGSVLIRIAKALGTSTDYLLGYSSDKTDTSDKVTVLQRNLTKLNSDELDKAEGVLKVLFSEAFGENDE